MNLYSSLSKRTHTLAATVALDGAAVRQHGERTTSILIDLGYTHTEKDMYVNRTCTNVVCFPQL